MTCRKEHLISQPERSCAVTYSDWHKVSVHDACLWRQVTQYINRLQDNCRKHMQWVLGAVDSRLSTCWFWRCPHTWLQIYFKGATGQIISFIVTKYPVHRGNILYSRLNDVLHEQVTIKEGSCTMQCNKVSVMLQLMHKVYLYTNIHHCL